MPTRGVSRPRSRAADARGAAAGPSTEIEQRAQLLERAAELLRAAARRAGGAGGARGRQDARRCASARCARRWITCATTRRRSAREFDARDASCRSVPWPASARGISRWRSSPGRSPRRSPPATPCSPSPPSRPAPPRRCAVQLLHQAGMPDVGAAAAAGRRRAGRHAAGGDARVRGVLFTGSTAAARSIARTLGDARRGAVDRRDRRPERDDRRFHRAARAGGRRRAALGLRFRRPALLGAARAVSAAARSPTPVLQMLEGAMRRAARRRSGRHRHRCRPADR